MERQVIARLIDRSPEQQQESGCDAQLAGASSSTRKPGPQVRQPAPGFRCGIGDSNSRVQQESGDPSIAQLPDRSVQNKVVDVYQRGKYQETCGEIMVEQTAREPRAGDEQSYAADDQHSEVGPGAPVAAILGRRLSPSIIARNPEVLRRVHNREYSRTVTALWNFQTFDEGDYRR